MDDVCELGLAFGVTSPRIDTNAQRGLYGMPGIATITQVVVQCDCLRKGEPTRRHLELLQGSLHKLFLVVRWALWIVAVIRALLIGHDASSGKRPLEQRLRSRIATARGLPLLP